MKRTIVAVALAALALSGAGVLAAADNDLWLHVKVEEDNDAKVTVNLPMSVIGKALPMLPEEHLDAGRVHLDEMEMSISEMRELWQELQGTPDATFVTVEEEDESVRVWKEGGYLMVSVTEGDGGENVEVRVPARVVDALLSGEGEELDLMAAMEALVAEGEGQLVQVTGDSEKVRVWVDRVAEAD
jgi:hypothetical protein